MGVPGFFKWLAQRYPLICETYHGSAAEKDDAFRLLQSMEQKDTAGVQDGDFEVPDGFDNLYLDVNGIIHNCSHSIEDLCAGIRCEEDIFVLIFQYINNLVKIVRPRNMVYLAIDGVAPMAKIIQQRDRRFRSARDSQKSDIVFKALKEEEGEAEPEVEDAEKDKSDFKFDAIQITPGTPFMQRLTIRLQYFAQMMIHENKFWKHLKIVVSGSDVPGEGEHKIMEYIRNDKTKRHEAVLNGQKPHYISHCIYGLDADLIMLSLATHEPYICLLREQVYFFNKQTHTRHLINIDDYVFMHVGILREYLLNDMIQLEELRNVPSTIDRVVDDFVFITMFMGNDFLPHGKFSKIADGGINAYIATYDRYIRDSYKATPYGDIWLVTGCGEINYDNLLKFLGMLSKREVNRITDELYCGPDNNNHKVVGRKPRKEVSHEITVIDVENMCIEHNPTEFNSKYKEKPKTVAEWTGRYYLAKMGIANDVILQKGNKSKTMKHESPQCIDEVVADYMEAIQWVMYYYYRGVPSWNWYLRCRYAPLLSDVFKFLKGEKIKFHKSMAGKNMAKVTFTVSQVLKIQFEFSAPITPFEQLMMVLPPVSAYLLPSIFGVIMTDPDSPLRKYYPENFDVDMDDTNVQWGGVTLLHVIPHEKLLLLMNGMLFCDGTVKFEEKRMPTKKLHYMESSKLTEDEKFRNGLGLARVYFYNPESSGKTVESPLSTFDDIKHCMVDYKPFFNPSLKSGQTFTNQLMMYQRNSKTKHINPNQRKSNVWFPSLSSASYVPFIKTGVQVFHVKSHAPSLFLWIRQSIHRDALRNLMNAAKAKYVVVGYPYQYIGRLESIHTPYLTIKDGHMSVGNPSEVGEQLVILKGELEKRGITLSHKSPDPNLIDHKDWAKMSSQFLIKLVDGLPGCALSPNLPSVRQARAAGLDHVCENVIVKYRILDINLQDTTLTGSSLLPFVRFVDHIKESVPQMNRAVFRDQKAVKPDVALSNNLSEMVALRNTIRQHEMLYGKYSKPVINAICIMDGSLYGCVGTVDTVGNTFDEISAIFPVPDFRITIAESAQQKLDVTCSINKVVEDRRLEKWHSFSSICKLAAISEKAAMIIFNSVTCGQFAEELGMLLAHWDDERGCTMCLPGYTRCSNAFLTMKDMSDSKQLFQRIEYSEDVIELIKSYRRNCPEIFTYFDGNIQEASTENGKQRVNIPLEKLFPQTSEELLDFKKGEVKQYVSGQVFRRLKLTPGNYQCLKPIDISAISEIYDECKTTSAGAENGDCKLIRVSHVKNLHIPSYTTGSIFVREEEIYLGQCVVYIKHSESVPLGTRGTVVGIYPQNKDGSNRMFELLLEKAFVGGTHLFGRCANMRGLFVSISDIMPIHRDTITDPEECIRRNQALDRKNAPYISYV
ncbi:5'-3' exoribonuclease [Babesia gibsoni]|uniref:5'-3' exoribonuclease n=1 Tax=Babesia gibsoni TaxID=33632 RepID=A0AAD8UU36_BABGI|nr:5'-3' exoribonuclease [Babesia gibsoni]